MSQKLQEELQYEEEVAAQEAEEGEPTFLKDFKEAGNWVTVSSAGSDFVPLNDLSCRRCCCKFAQRGDGTRRRLRGGGPVLTRKFNSRPVAQ